MSRKLTSYLLEVTEKWYGGAKGRPFIDHVIDIMGEKWDKDHIFVVEAPTGYGKSTISATIALYSLYEEFKAIVAFPLRTLLEDQYSKFRRLVKSDVLGKRYMHAPDSPYLIKPITLTTVDTLSLTLFGIPPEDLEKVIRYWTGTSRGSLGHYLFSWASVALSNIILDEAHLLADSTKSLNFLIALMKTSLDNGQKLILMSATIPEALKRVFSNQLGTNLHLISFDKSYDEEFIRERESKRYKITVERLHKDEKYEVILSWIKDLWKEFKKVIVVFNTAKDAIAFYSLLRSTELGEHTLLLHSRFSEEDRSRKIRFLRKKIEEGKYIVVSTQVIEAGVDVSSDLFITEAAPANSIVQRLGRFLRYKGETEGKVYIWYEVDMTGELSRRKDMYKVYSWDLTRRTIDYLLKERNVDFHVPKSYKPFLDYVYAEKDFNVDEDWVNELRRILISLEQGSLVAIEKFFKMEASFVREGYLVPVITPDLIEGKINGEKMLLNVNELSRLTVPLNLDILTKIKPLGEIVIEDGELRMKDIDLSVFENAHKGKSNIYKITRHLVKERVAAFLVNGNYSEERGLIIGNE